MERLGLLRFRPLFRRYLWGGRRLELLLGKQLGEGTDYAESWEIVDHGADQSVVAAGAFAGRTLNELVRELGPRLLGAGASARFPLLFKFLDAHQALSVQVHPNDEQAARLVPPDLGKTEAWVVVHADPGSVIYAGLKRGFDRAAFVREVQRGTTELCLHRFEPRVGDCVLIPAGTVHALGAGLVIAEIQQASDTTFRLFDWNRVGADGRPRQLHIEQALGVIDFARGPVVPQTPQPTGRPGVERLVDCDKFVLHRWRVSPATSCEPLGGDGRLRILVVLEGAARFDGDEVLTKGQTALLPAGAAAVPVTPLEPTTLLEIAPPSTSA